MLNDPRSTRKRRRASAFRAFSQSSESTSDSFVETDVTDVTYDTDASSSDCSSVSAELTDSACSTVSAESATSVVSPPPSVVTRFMSTLKNGVKRLKNDVTTGFALVDTFIKQQTEVNSEHFEANLRISEQVKLLDEQVATHKLELMELRQQLDGLPTSAEAPIPLPQSMPQAPIPLPQPMPQAQNPVQRPQEDEFMMNIVRKLYKLPDNAQMRAVLSHDRRQLLARIYYLKRLVAAHEQVKTRSGYMIRGPSVESFKTKLKQISPTAIYEGIIYYAGAQS